MESQQLHHPYTKRSITNFKIKHMETRKNEKTNLENMRSIFLQTGYAIAIALCLIVFDWKSSPSNNDFTNSVRGEEIIEDRIPITKEQEPIKEKIMPPRVRTILNIVTNNTKIDDEIDWSLFDNNKQAILDLSTFFKEEKNDSDDIIIEKATMMPRFKNKDINTFNSHFSKNFEIPEWIYELDIKGKLEISFVIEKDGKVSSVVIERELDPQFDKIVAGFISNSSDWSPGMNKGKLARVKLLFPLVIQ